MAERHREKPLSESIRERRSTPHFDSAALDAADLRKILEAGTSAPSGYNTQPWRFVVVTDKAAKSSLQKFSFDQARVGEASVVIVACGDEAGMGGEILEDMLHLAKEHGYGDDRQHDLVRKNYPNFLASVEKIVWLNRQVAIALTHMMLMAEVLGYDTAMMEGYKESEVKKLLRIPDSAHVVAMLCIGRLVGPDKPFGGRFKLGRTVFSERWGEPFE
jgi:nitroreductase